MGSGKLKRASKREKWIRNKERHIRLSLSLYSQLPTLSFLFVVKPSSSRSLGGTSRSVPVSTCCKKEYLDKTE